MNVFNLNLETCSAKRIERKRLEALESTGIFNKPAFPVAPGFLSIDVKRLYGELAEYEDELDSLKCESTNDVGFQFDNGWFSSPDAEVAYCMVRRFQPRRVIEIGSGHSTKLLRQALIDSCVEAKLTSIDPQPRAEIDDLADHVYRQPVELLSNPEVFGELSAGDILFIDSSHTVRTGSDVVFLLLKVLPTLVSGVVVQIHDIFLPYEYPREWVVDEQWGWNEQHLVQALLSSEHGFKVLWAGYYLQQTREDFLNHFPRHSGVTAKSLWLQKL